MVTPGLFFFPKYCCVLHFIQTGIYIMIVKDYSCLVLCVILITILKRLIIGLKYLKTIVMLSHIFKSHFLLLRILWKWFGWWGRSYSQSLLEEEARGSSRCQQVPQVCQRIWGKRTLSNKNPLWPTLKLYLCGQILFSLFFFFSDRMSRLLAMMMMMKMMKVGVLTLSVLKVRAQMRARGRALTWL